MIYTKLEQIKTLYRYKVRKFENNMIKLNKKEDILTCIPSI